MICCRVWVLQGFTITKSSGSHLDAKLGAYSAAIGVGEADKVLLQRVYGMAFSSADELAKWEVRHQQRGMLSWRLLRPRRLSSMML